MVIWLTLSVHLIIYAYAWDDVSQRSWSDPFHATPPTPLTIGNNQMRSTKRSIAARRRVGHSTRAHYFFFSFPSKKMEREIRMRLGKSLSLFHVSLSLSHVSMRLLASFAFPNPITMVCVWFLSLPPTAWSESEEINPLTLLATLLKKQHSSGHFNFSFSSLILLLLLF